MRNDREQRIESGGQRRSLSILLLFSAFLIVGCRHEMQEQPKLTPLRGSALFDDHRGARPQPAHTVERNQSMADDYDHTGVVAGDAGYKKELELMPFPVTMQVLRRGQEQFNVYCAPCHSRVGNGLGETVQRGFPRAANLNDQVRLSQLLSHYYYVISHGYNAMPDYAAQISVEDRWAVAAYLRALQLSQAANPSDVPPGVTVKELKDVAAAKSHPEYTRPWPVPPVPATAKEGPDSRY